MLQYLTLPHVFVVHQHVHPVQVYIVTYQPTHAVVVTLAPTLMDQKKILLHVHAEVPPAMICMDYFVTLKEVYVLILSFQICVQFVMVQLPALVSANVEIYYVLYRQV